MDRALANLVRINDHIADTCPDLVTEMIEAVSQGPVITGFNNVDCPVVLNRPPRNMSL